MSADMRIGDAERDAAVSALGEHFVAGRLSSDEHDERTTAAWSARTARDLEPLFADLPRTDGTSARPSAGRPAGPRRWPLPRSWTRTGWPALMLVPVLVVALALAFVAWASWFVIGLFAWLLWCGMRHSRSVHGGRATGPRRRNGPFACHDSRWQRHRG